jgi:hypothetical protein
MKARKYFEIVVSWVVIRVPYSVVAVTDILVDHLNSAFRFQYVT